MKSLSPLCQFGREGHDQGPFSELGRGGGVVFKVSGQEGERLGDQVRFVGNDFSCSNQLYGDGLTITRSASETTLGLLNSTTALSPHLCPFILHGCSLQQDLRTAADTSVRST